MPPPNAPVNLGGRNDLLHLQNGTPVQSQDLYATIQQNSNNPRVWQTEEPKWDGPAQCPAELKALVSTSWVCRLFEIETQKVTKAHGQQAPTSGVLCQLQKVKNTLLFSSKESSHQHSRWPSSISSPPWTGSQGKFFVNMWISAHTLPNVRWDNSTVPSFEAQPNPSPSSWATTGITYAHRTHKSYLTEYIFFKHNAD